MKNYIKMTGLNILLVCILFASNLQASENNLMVTNVTGGQFTVSWTTSHPCTGKASLYHSSDFIGHYYDNRGEDFKGTTHYVTIKGLSENADYSFATDSGDISDDNDGHLYQVTTGANLIPVGSIQPAGKVLLSDGYTPATGTIVYVTVYRAENTSAPLSALTDANGYWFLDLVNARNIDNKELFRVSENDMLVISAKQGKQGSAYLEAPVMDNAGGTKLYDPLILK